MNKQSRKSVKLPGTLKTAHLGFYQVLRLYIKRVPLLTCRFKSFIISEGDTTQCIGILLPLYIVVPIGAG